MVGAGTKRKRRERGNRVAAAVEEGRRQAAAEKKALGTVVTADVPNSELFVEDRKGVSKEALKEHLHEQANEQRRAAKRAKRNALKVRKSEAAIVGVTEAAKNGYFPGKKKKGVGAVESAILSKRKFDRPEGHVGNVSAVIREGKSYADGKEDVWTSETHEKVSSEIGLNRRRLAEKMNASQRQAPSVIHPESGLSINPSHEDHQDKLGEAVAKVVEEDDEKTWNEQKMSYDPALLHESTEGEVADTGMKCDDNTSDEEEEEVTESHYRGVPERKTRTQRHKEARKRVMAANVARKSAEARRIHDLENLDALQRKAQKEADKLNGVTKLRKIESNPPPPPSADQPVLKKIAGQRVRNEKTNDPVLLSNELSDSMRGIKMPVANPILRDRFLSYERRGMIEPPKVLPKELWRMEQAKIQEEMRDKRKRKGRGSRSNLTFWRNGKRVIQ